MRGFAPLLLLLLSASPSAVAQGPLATSVPATAPVTAWRHPLVKTGYLNSPLVEVTPFVFKDRLYRLDCWQKFWEIPGAAPTTHHDKDEVRVRDVEADTVVSVPLVGHGFGFAFVSDGRVYVFAGDYGRTGDRIITEIAMVSSADLVTWSPRRVVLRAEPGEQLFNVAVCRGGEGKFVLLYETNDPRWPPFTFKYCTSTDLATWTRVPDALYGTTKYVGGPALYYEGGWYYTLYLEDMGQKWETRVTRSKDLVTWHDAPPGRPFVTFDPARKNLPLRPPDITERNASDAELCYFRGKTIVYFSGSDQQVAGDLQTAEYAGTPRELLEGFYAP